MIQIFTFYSYHIVIIIIIIIITLCKGVKCLVRVSNTRHAGHHAEHVIVNGIHTDLGSVDTADGTGGKHKLKDGVVNAGEVAAARWLVLLGAKGKRVDVDTGIGGTGVVLEGLHNIEVGTLTLREAVLAVKLELGGDHRVLTPAVHVKGGLGKHEGAGIGKTGKVLGKSGNTGITVGNTIKLEEAVGDEGIGTGHTGLAGERMDGVGKGIDGISVVEGLGTKSLEKSLVLLEGSTVVNVGIGLHNPHKLLTGVVEVKLDLVGRRTDRLITSELELLNEVLMGVLGHLAALLGVKEDVVHVKRSSNKRLLVGGLDGLGTRRGRAEALHGPQAFTDGAEVNVDLDLVVLEGNKRKSKTGVTAEPEKEGHVKGGLGEGVAGSAHLGVTGGGTGAIHVGESGVGKVGKLSGVTNHLVVTGLLLLGKSELVPDVHPVTVLTVDALTTNLNLNLGNELLTHAV